MDRRDQLNQIIRELLEELPIEILHELTPFVDSPLAFTKSNREEIIDDLVGTHSLDQIYIQLMENDLDNQSKPDKRLIKIFDNAYNKLEKKGLLNMVSPWFRRASIKGPQKQYATGKILTKREKEQEKEREKERERLKQKSQMRVEKMVKEFEEGTDDWDKEYAKASIKEADEWVKEYERSILDFFISSEERQMIKQQLQNLASEQKKFIVDMVLQSKSLLKMSPEKQREYVADFIRRLAKQGPFLSKF